MIDLLCAVSFSHKKKTGRVFAYKKNWCILIEH